MEDPPFFMLRSPLRRRGAVIKLSQRVPVGRRELHAIHFRADGVGLEFEVRVAQVDAPQRVRAPRGHRLRGGREVCLLDGDAAHVVLHILFEENTRRVEPVANLCCFVVSG